MEKRGMLIVAAIVLLLPLVLASSVDDEIKKLTYYAEEYETGNINYVQLVTYTSSIRENLNELLGASSKEDGGILKQEQIKKVLGEPTGYTDWVWVEGEEQEKRVDEEVPFWEKIIFDGKKIQIRLNSYPSIFKKKYFEGEKQQPSENEGKLIYRLNFYTQFKKPKEEMNIKGKVEEIKRLAETFNSDPSQENAEALAKESVNVEKSFESYFRQSGENCEDVMNGLFGAENKREEQKLIVNEIDYYEGNNFDAKARLEFCDDCSYHYASLDMWLDTRGKINLPEEKPEEKSYEKPASISFEQFKLQVNSVLEMIKSSLDNKDFGGFSDARADLRKVTEAWNQASNNIWKELDEKYRKKGEIIGKDNPDPYWWVALEKDKRAEASQIQDANYQKTKEFYSQIFSGYDKKEYFFQQAQWEKRLIEEFTESGEEICDNNQDDNENGQIDCQEDQCGGKVCGWGEVEIEQVEQVEAVEQVEKAENAIENEAETTESETEAEENSENTSVSDTIITGGVIEETPSETSATLSESSATVSETSATAEVTAIKKKVQLYCISGECRAKEEFSKENAPICGNHICESGEECPKDCSVCPQYSAVQCSGKVIFSGEDEKGCPLKPVCIEEKSCEKNEDCLQPLCGKAECVIENGIGTCKTAGFEECKEAECVEGEEKTQLCLNNEKRIIKICQEGKWVDTGVSECETVKEDIKEEELIGNDCNVKEDCGNADDVCSNGRCVTLPKTERVEKEEKAEQEEIKETEEREPSEEQQQEEQQEPEESQQLEEPQQPAEDSSAEGQLTGGAVTGHQTEEPEVKEAVPQETESEEVQQPEPPQQETQPGEEQPQAPEENAPQPVMNEMQEEYQEEDRRQEEERREEERERRIRECKDNSERECTNRYVMDCVGRCVFKDNEEHELEACKKSCAEEHEQEINDCISRCADTCEKEDWCQIDWPQGNMQEKGVFNFGGVCRTSQQKTESFIFFNGWGDPFDRLQSLKNKYYEGGESDWCKSEFDSLIKEREELEKSLNQDYAVWFFEKYLANSAEEWEQHVSGIYEMYWRIVDNQRQLARTAECAGKELPEFNLINITYSTEYGSLELWEELKTAKLPELDNKETEIVSPYMKLWIFPPEEFIKYEMKKAMESGEFPGSPEEKLERKNEGGLKEEEKDKIRNNARFMKKIRKLAEEHGGSYDGAIQIKDYQTGEIIFNIFVRVNEQEILYLEPMPPEKVPETDISVTLDFDKIYELVGVEEKDMKREEIQMPPWEKEKIKPVKKIKEAVNGIKMFFKVRDLINSAEYSPKEAKGEVKSIVNSFMLLMMEEGGREGEPNMEEMTEEEKQQAEEIKNELLNSKEALTGEVIMRI